MAEAIVLGARQSGALTAEVCVADPNTDRHPVFGGGVRSATEAIEWLDTRPSNAAILLAFKPQVLDEVGAEIGHAVGDRLVISILAGCGTDRVRQAMGGRCPVVRAMPNTPAFVGRGTTAIAVGPAAADADTTAAESLFRGVGSVVVRLDESLIDAFTGVAGSGPAYLFYLAQAMERAAVDLGLPAADAGTIVAETLAGAAELLRRSGDPPADLRSRVTSKGGTTAAATTVFDEAGLMKTVVRAITAARDRGRELGG